MYNKHNYILVVRTEKVYFDYYVLVCDLFIYKALHTQIYTVILYRNAIVNRLCILGCQIHLTSTLTMFDIQDKILYTLEFKLKCKIYLYTYYLKYMFPVRKPEIKLLHNIIKRG